MVECRDYLESSSYRMDDRARKCLLGARPLVMECVLQHPNGHVCRWATKEPKMALVGLVRNLELTWQIYGEGIRFPRGLVPCAACCRRRFSCVQMDSSRWHSWEFDDVAKFTPAQLREHYHAKDRLIAEASDLRDISRGLEERAEVAEAFPCQFVLHCGYCCQAETAELRRHLAQLKLVVEALTPSDDVVPKTKFAVLLSTVGFLHSARVLVAPTVTASADSGSQDGD